MTDEPPMGLCRALSILVEAHTRDDNLVGFTVEMGGPDRFWSGSADYITAWAVVRRAVGRQTRPAEAATSTESEPEPHRGPHYRSPRAARMDYR